LKYLSASLSTGGVAGGVTGGVVSGGFISGGVVSGGFISGGVVCGVIGLISVVSFPVIEVGFCILAKAFLFITFASGLYVGVESVVAFTSLVLFFVSVAGKTGLTCLGVGLNPNELATLNDLFIVGSNNLFIALFPKYCHQFAIFNI